MAIINNSMEGVEGQDVDMMAAVVGEEYFNHRMKVFCL